jgi:hypothetical protein
MGSKFNMVLPGQKEVTGVYNVASKWLLMWGVDA